MVFAVVSSVMALRIVAHLSLEALRGIRDIHERWSLLQLFDVWRKWN
jgi:hypothetical protein